MAANPRTVTAAMDIVSALLRSDLPLTHAQLAAATGRNLQTVISTMKRHLLPIGRVERARSAGKMHKWLYTLPGRGFAGVELLRDKPRPMNRADCCAVRRERAIERRAMQFVTVGHNRPRPLKPKLERFPDPRFAPEDRRPLTAREEWRLWRWANRA